MRIEKSTSLNIIIFLLLLLNSIVLPPLVVAKDTETTIRNTGFTKGVSWKPVIPMKINFTVSEV